MPNLIKLQNGKLISLCDFHKRTLGEPGKLVGTSPEECSQCVVESMLKATTPIKLREVRTTICTYNLTNARWTRTQHVDTCLNCGNLIERDDDDVFYVPVHLGFFCRLCGELLIPPGHIGHAGKRKE